MKKMNAFLALALMGLFVIPSVNAQTTAPIAACDPKNCDPKVANGNAIKTGDDTTTVILYGHFEDILNQAPLNTQQPDQQRETDLNRGFLMPTVDTWTGQCTPSPTNVCPDFHFKNNEFRMYSSPGLVEYLQEGWRTHQEPGLAADAELQGDHMTLYWYLSSYAVPNGNSQDTTGRTAKVGLMPEVAIYSRMNTGRFEFLGDLIAESASYDASQLPGGQRINMISSPADANDVYEFAVPMKIVSPVIPSSETKNGFLVYVNPYQINNGDYKKQNSAQLGQEEWRVRTGSKYPPRLVMDVKHPMQTKASSLSIFEKRLFVRWSFVSVWGSYDLRDASLTLAPTTGKIDPKAIDFIILKRSVDHDGHFKPVNATWAIEYGANDPQYKLPDGDYELTASIMNLQETFQLVQKFNFKVVNGKPDVQEIGAGSKAGGGAAGGAKAAGSSDKSGIPGFEAGSLVAAVTLAALLAVGRRRKN